jgi:hypothetical protein
MEKKPYYRIDLKNCNTDYDHTICEWQDVHEYLELVKQQAEDLDEETYSTFKESGWLPEAKVSVVLMTDQEFSEWFRDNVEANA